mmetsp:Transcript_660/g.1514  ORF Transcript_660/g.1514 Transcript_660/m.1514 type:complete len:281 (+) Transcript_660:1087-1929(+)
MAASTAFWTCSSSITGSIVCATTGAGVGTGIPAAASNAGSERTLGSAGSGGGVADARFRIMTFPSGKGVLLLLLLFLLLFPFFPCLGDRLRRGDLLLFFFSFGASVFASLPSPVPILFASNSSGFKKAASFSFAGTLLAAGTIPGGGTTGAMPGGIGRSEGAGGVGMSSLSSFVVFSVGLGALLPPAIAPSQLAKGFAAPGKSPPPLAGAAGGAAVVEASAASSSASSTSYSSSSNSSSSYSGSWIPAIYGPLSSSAENKSVLLLVVLGGSDMLLVTVRH